MILGRLFLISCILALLLGSAPAPEQGRSGVEALRGEQDGLLVRPESAHSLDEQKTSARHSLWNFGIALGRLSLPDDAFLMKDRNSPEDVGAPFTGPIENAIPMQMAYIERTIGSVRLMGEMGLGFPMYKRAVSGLSSSSSDESHVSLVADGFETLWGLTTLYDAALLRIGEGALLVSFGARVVRTTVVRQDIETGAEEKEGRSMWMCSTRLRWNPKSFDQTRIQGVDANLGSDFSGAHFASIGIPVAIGRAERD